jgi:hypothetical protein
MPEEARSSQPIFDAIDAGHWQFIASVIDVKNGLITSPQVGEVLCRRCLEPMPCEPLRVARAACRPLASTHATSLVTTPALRLPGDAT